MRESPKWRPVAVGGEPWRFDSPRTRVECLLCESVSNLVVAVDPDTHEDHATVGRDDTSMVLCGRCVRAAMQAVQR